MSEETDKKNASENPESMAQESQEVKSPALTLNPDEVEYDMSFMEPSLKEKDLKAKLIHLEQQRVQWMNRCCQMRRKNRLKSL